MSRIDTWMKRFKYAGLKKPRERVHTDAGIETLTYTQAYRYKQLKRMHAVDQPKRRRARNHPQFMSLAEVEEITGAEREELLVMAADSHLKLFVDVAGLRGQWQWADHVDSDILASSKPVYLALPPASCRDIAAYGSANVSRLEKKGNNGDRAVFNLWDPLWVGPEKIVLLGPLPGLLERNR